VLLLRQICKALSLPLTELLREEGSQSVELTLIDAVLEAPPCTKTRGSPLEADAGVRE
jgi:hypothetical protein